MKYRNFTAGIFRFPFHKKKIICFLSVCLLTAVFALSSAAANDNVRQNEVGETKQLIKQAEKLTRKGELDRAEKILREVIERNPGDSKARLGLSHVLIKQRRIIEAYDLSFEIAKAEPKNSYAFAILGTTLLHAGNFRNAQVAFFNALKLNNQESLAWLGLGMLDFYENRITQGLESLREAVYLEPNEPDFLYALAQVSARAERYKDAAEAYKRFLRVSSQTDVERRDRIKGLIN